MAMIGSPVFRKEMISLARQKRSFLLRGLVLSAMILVIILAWQEAASYHYRAYDDFSYIGAALFRGFGIIQMMLVLLIVPALSASVVAVEKEQQTLGLLLMSNLRPANILLDKLLSRALMIFLLLLSGLPLFILILIFGGVTPMQLAILYLAILALMLLICGTGLVCSTFLASSVSAIAASYLLLTGWQLGFFYIASGLYYLDEAVYALNPVMLIAESLGDGEDVEILAIALVQLFLAAVYFTVMLAICSLRLPGEGARRRRHPLEKLSAAMTAFFKTDSALDRVIIGEQALHTNPVLWRETQKRFFASNTFLVRSAYIIAIGFGLLLIFACFLSLVDIDGLAMYSNLLTAWPVIFLYLALIALLGSILAAAAFAREHAQHTMDLLLSTPVEGRHIVLAKLSGVCKALLVPVLLPIVFYLIALWLQNHHYGLMNELRDFLVVFSLFLSGLAFLIVLGLRFSASSRSVLLAFFKTVLTAIPAFLALAFISQIIQLFLYQLNLDAIELLLMLLLINLPWVLILSLFICRFDRIMGRL